MLLFCSIMFLFDSGERNTLGQVAKDITEMTHKISFLDLCRTHLQVNMIFL